MAPPTLRHRFVKCIMGDSPAAEKRRSERAAEHATQTLNKSTQKLIDTAVRMQDKENKA